MVVCVLGVELDLRRGDGSPERFARFLQLTLLGKSRFPFASTSSEGSSSPPVVLGHEEVTNGEEIVGEFLLVMVFDVC